MITFKQYLKEIAKVHRGFPKVKRSYYSNTDFDFETNPDKEKELNLDDQLTSRKERLALNKFKRNSYYINKGKRETPTDKALSSLINRYTIPTDTYVYHGNNRLKNLYKQKPNKHGVIELTHDNHYTSTSLDHGVAARFSDSLTNPKNNRDYTHVLKIHVPKGSHVLPINYRHDNEFDYNDDFEDEREVILHRGAKFHVDPTPSYDNKKGLVTWHANLAHDGIKPTRHSKG